MACCHSSRQFFFRTLCFISALLLSPATYALSDVVAQQNPHNVAALIYGLLGLLALFLITPVVQFYVGAVRASNHRQALSQHARALAEEQSEQTAVTPGDQTEKPERTMPSPPLQNVVDDSPVGVCRLNGQYEIISANHSLVTRLNYQESDLRKGDIFKLFADADTAERCARLLQSQQRLAGEHVEFITRDGDSLPVELTVERLADGHEEYICWIVNYSDEQFQYDKFNSLLENSGLPVGILTKQGFVKLNKNAYKFLQVESEVRLQGLSLQSLSINHSKEKADELASLVDTVMQKGGVSSLPWSHKINGETVPCEITLVPLYKAHQLDSLMCVWTDLRELHQASELLKTTSSELQALRLEKAQSQTQTLQQLRKTETELEQTQALLTQLQQDHGIATDRVKALELKLSERNRQADASSDTPATDAKQTLRSADTTITSQETALRERDKKIAAMTLSLEAEQRQISALQSQITGLKSALHKKQQENELLDYQLDRLEAEQENATDFIRRLTQQLNVQRKSAQQLNTAQTKDSATTTIQTLRGQLDAVMADSLKEKQQLLEAKAKVDADLASTKAALNKTQKHARELMASCEQHQADNKQHTDLIDTLMSQLTALKDDVRQQAQTASEHGQNAELQALQRALNERQAELDRTKTELTQLKQTLTLKLKQQRHTDAQLAALQQKEQDYQARLKEAHHAHTQLTDKLAALQKQTRAAGSQAPTPPQSLSAILQNRPDIESIVLPTKPVSWFDLNYFWASQPSDFRLSLSLSALLDEIDTLLRRGDSAVRSAQMTEISQIAEQLQRVSKTVNADQLIDLAQSFTRDCRLGMKDNALVRWQPTKQALQKSQRVIYEQLRHV
ncbi:PAS domain-containing protein [Alteromonas halophila]|uniref:PAS domain-containing protein n=1 Tax=Alteromonas halophila TaxID=516698 RepID=A0A918JJG6_9ALTE|nr:PAS domain-containing protein [Alteromonas halophila]GGW81659.1 hypothetical protein GCM10007391_13600 [Alteromonas halophila]